MTPSPDRKLYQAQIYNFLRTVTIKYEPFALYINATLLRKGYSVSDFNKRSWKYYLNMAGKYHEADTVMDVVSLDTHQKIVFSADVLKDHPRTRAAYQPGGPYYGRLVNRYPRQVDLIKSVLYPVVDIDAAILSEDLTLLSWGSGHLEEWEESGFIDDIVQFLTVVKERWYFDFLKDEPFFYLTFWANLQTYLAMLLMSGRLANIRTPYVHSQHIWDSLQGKGLSNYSDILNREKSLLLYQNMDYFRANAGKQSNLEILSDRLLKSFGIGLYSRIVLQEAETAADTYQLTPQFIPLPIPILSNAVPSQAEIKTTAVIQADLVKQGLTPSDSGEMVETVNRTMGDTRLNRFSTKLMEIKPLVRLKPYSETLNMFLMETLIVAITEGYYTKPIDIVDPLTGGSIYLSPAEFLALGNYATLKSLGVAPDTIPNKTQLYRSFLTSIGTPGKRLNHYGNRIFISEQADATSFLSDLHYDENIANPAAFSAMVSRLWLRYMSHTLFDQNTLLDKRRHVAEYLASMCHQRREVEFDLVPGYTDYTTWLGPEGVDIQNTILDQYFVQGDPKLQWSNLANAIWSALIPVTDTLEKFGNFTLSNAGYERLRQLFVQMCSYQIVFLEADRDTSQFSIGAKWSTEYGPCLANSFGDFTVFSQGTFVTESVSTRSREIQSGFDQEVLNRSEAKSKHELTMVSKTSNVGVTSFTAPKHRVMTGKSRSVSVSSVTKPNQTPQFKPVAK